MNTINGDTCIIKSNKDKVDLESMLHDLKIFGRYHLKLMFLVGLLTMGHVWTSMNYVFAVENIGYRCKYPNCEYRELSKLQINSSLDYICHKYKLYDSNNTCTEENFDVTNVTNCEEWVYDRPDSFVAEFNLGCADWKRTLVGTMHNIGLLLGLLLVGPLSDKFGRKKLVIFASVARTVIGLSKSIVYSYWIYVTLETLEPMLGNYNSAAYTLAIESVTKEHRALMAFVLSIFTTVGGIAFAIIAWLAPNWRIFLLSIYAPGLIFILYIFWLDESIRWLLNKGKKTEVDEIIRRAAKMNNVVIEEDKLSKLKCGDNSSNVNLITLVKLTFSSKNLLLRTLACICMWFTAIFNTYSFLINSVSLKGNKYLNYGLTTLIGVPASVAILYLLERCQRKKPLIFSFLLTGTFCMVHSIVPTDYAWLSLVLYSFGRFFSIIGLRIVRIYMSELFPTYTRNTMHALCSAVGGTAAVIAPQTPLLLEYWSGFPSLIVGILSLLTAGVMTLLPNTSDDVLPENVCQAETVGKKDKVVVDCRIMCSKL